MNSNSRVMMAFASAFSFAAVSSCETLRALPVDASSGVDAKGSELKVASKSKQYPPGSEEQIFSDLYDEALRLPRKELAKKFCDCLKITEKEFPALAEKVEEVFEKLCKQRKECLTSEGRDAVVHAYFANFVAKREFRFQPGSDIISPRKFKGFSRKFKEKCDELRLKGWIYKQSLDVTDESKNKVDLSDKVDLVVIEKYLREVIEGQVATAFKKLTKAEMMELEMMELRMDEFKLRSTWEMRELSARMGRNTEEEGMKLLMIAALSCGILAFVFMADKQSAGVGQGILSF